MSQPSAQAKRSRASRAQPETSDTQQAGNEQGKQEAHEESDEADRSNDGTASEEPTTGGGAAGPPTEEPPPFSGDEDARRELHAFLGELHGLLRTLERNLPRWCPADLQAEMRLAIAETHPAFGSANAELDIYAHAREVLPERGLAKDSLAMKLGRFRRKLATFYRTAVETAGDLFRPVQDVVRWALVPLDSLASEIPGGTAIKEIFLAINEAAAEKAASPTS